MVKEYIPPMTSFLTCDGCGVSFKPPLYELQVGEMVFMFHSFKCREEFIKNHESEEWNPPYWEDVKP